LSCYNGPAFFDTTFSFHDPFMNDQFNPPIILRANHLQSAMASLRPKWALQRALVNDLIVHSKEHILDCGDGIRLLGSLSTKNRKNRSLAVLIHGWEGSIDSVYMLSLGSLLFNQGIDIFRLNLRDHGKSHHLNRLPFTSTALAEVIHALKAIQELTSHAQIYLVGFSLGGNFVLRLGLAAKLHSIPIRAITAVSPLINPHATTQNLENNHPFYHQYFVKSWRRSLVKKLEHFPDLGYGRNILKMNSLHAMHARFVPMFTTYKTPEEYFAAYRLTEEMLACSKIPTLIIAADDDPIISGGDLDELGQPPSITFLRTQYGGHCGFIYNWQLANWADQQINNFILQYQRDDT
jgi:uncharacterized protein